MSRSSMLTEEANKMNQLERDYNHCHNIMKEHSKTFSYAFDFWI